MVGIKLAQWGMGMDEGRIVSWVKAEGDAVAEGETIAVVETPKAETEVSAPASGMLAEICVDAGEWTPVGTVIGWIDADATTEHGGAA